jgi:hypothetical protein
LEQVFTFFWRSDKDVSDTQIHLFTYMYFS